MHKPNRTLLNVILIEDELPGLEKLKAHLLSYSLEINVISEFDGVEAASIWFKGQNARMPDLIISDIQLTDGLVFSLFDQLKEPIPIIFATAFDQYTLKAFDFYSIDYLLKPITQEKVNKALDKFLAVRDKNKVDLRALSAFLKNGNQTNKRLLVKSGLAFKSLELEEVAYIYSEHKMSFVITMTHDRYIIDKTLQQLESELGAGFFRANRQFLLCHKALDAYKPIEKGKLLLQLIPKPNSEVVVSQERAAEFKKWAVT